MNTLAAGMDGWLVFWIALAVVLLIIMIVMFNFIGLYVRAMVSGAHVTFADLVGMRIRNVNPLIIVNSRIQAMRPGLQVSSREMESHVLAGGNVMRVINAMIAATKANIDLNWNVATAIDL